jgi:hypothetical protein
MAATFGILNQPVGDFPRLDANDVKRIQQLLFCTGFWGVEANGAWDFETKKAFGKFQQKQWSPSAQFFLCDSSPALCDPRNNVRPGDTLLFDLAFKAGVLIPLAPLMLPQPARVNRGSIAFLNLHEWCKANVTFTWSNHALWGLQGYRNWAIVTSDDPARFDIVQPRALNCTLYANLMMSMWHQGHVHGLPFDASLKKVGHEAGFLGKRYHYDSTKEYASLNDIASFTKKHPDRLYCLEPSGLADNIGHEALLFRGRIYECTPGKNCRDIPLKEWFVGSHTTGQISGPSPN